MRIKSVMGTTASQLEVSSPDATTPWRRVLAALEPLALYAGILLYIWRWQFSVPHAWMPLLAAVFLSHIAHGESLHDLGLTSRNLRANAFLIAPLAAALYLPVAIYALARHAWVWMPFGKQALISFATYGAWCLFQQYLAQSYFHNRLSRVVRNPHLSSALVALLFGGAHIPNPLLMAITTLGGFILAEVYARYRNIWPLALVQAVGGILLAALAPPSLIHNMRVGPGYFFYGLR